MANFLVENSPVWNDSYPSAKGPTPPAHRANPVAGGTALVPALAPPLAADHQAVFAAGILQPHPQVVGEAAPDHQLKALRPGAAQQYRALGEHRAHALAGGEVGGVHVV